jgi:heat shock protein HslJ
MAKKLNIVYLLITIAILSSLVLLAGACGTQNTMLEDTKWFLQNYGEQNNMKAVINDTEITAIFGNSKGEVNGSAGCNTFFAEYDMSRNTLLISSMAYTEMACISPEGVMEQEQDFLLLLANAQSFEADATTLTVLCSNGQQLYFTTDTR